MVIISTGDFFARAAVLLLVTAAAHAQENTTMSTSYTNPIFPGWHSDPTCVFVTELNNTFFCLTSTFLAFPGLPMYASKDLVNWQLASSPFNRPSQFPMLNDYVDQMDGVYAPTLRYHNGTFYMVVVMVGAADTGTTGLLLTTEDPFDDAAWSEGTIFAAPGIDSDLFWDDDVDGQAYLSFAGIRQAKFDPVTGELGEVYSLWNGTGGTYPEGPHIYKPWPRGHYYLLIAEGGTELNHSVTIARSTSVSGPYEAYEGNPILTNRFTDEYFQTVGHADLFRDASGNWWSAALSTRSGPAWVNYPMGRETVLVNATWEEGEWPVLSPVRGPQEGWSLPPQTRDIGGDGPFLGDPDVEDFAPGTTVPRQFVYWRFPSEGSFTVSPEERPNSLRLIPSRANLTGNAAFSPQEGITLVMRRQTDTLFTYSVDVEQTATTAGAEIGVTAFLTQFQHIDLGVVALPSNSCAAEGGASPLVPHFRFRVTGVGNELEPPPATVVNPVPEAWAGQPLRLTIQAVNDTFYAFSAGLADGAVPGSVVGYAPSTILSGGTGPFTGTLVGVYATSNGRNGTAPGYVSRWRYQGQGQKVGNGDDDYVPSTPI